MSDPVRNRSCRLKRFEFPKYWEEIVENPESTEQVIARIKELYGTHCPDEGEGIFFFLEDDQGDHFHVGRSEEGWVLAYCPRVGAEKAAIGDVSATGHKAFLTPEWTDIERKHLIAPTIAECVLKAWIQTGQLSHEVRWEE